MHACGLVHHRADRGGGEPWDIGMSVSSLKATAECGCGSPCGTNVWYRFWLRRQGVPHPGSFQWTWHPEFRGSLGFPGPLCVALQQPLGLWQPGGGARAELVVAKC